MAKTADDWFNLAGQFVNVSNHEQAIVHYDKALAIDPDHIDSLLGKGLALNRLGKSEEAVKWINRVIELKPDLAVAHSRKAMALKSLGRKTEALESVNKALSLDPNSDLVHTEKAIVLCEMGRTEDAMASYRKAISINVKRVNAHWGLGGLLENQNRGEEALECYKEAAKHQPCAMFYMLMGKCLERLGREKEAIEAFNTCVEYYEKGQPGIGLSTGNLSFIKNELKAIKELQGIAAQAEAKAKELEEKAKQTNPNNPFVKDFISKIASLQADKDKITHTVLSKADKGGASQSDKDELKRVKDEFAKQLAEMEAAMQKQMNEVKTDVNTLKNDVAELKKGFAEVKEELDNKLDDWNKKLDKTLDTQDLTPEDKMKMKEYYGAFVSTFSSIYVTSQVVDSGQVVIDSDNSTATVLSMVASFAPFIGGALSNGIKSLGDFLQAQEMKKSAKKMKSLANDSTELSQLIGKVAFEIATNTKKQQKVFKTTDAELDQISGNLFQKIRTVCQNLQGDVDAFLYTKLYNSTSARVGHNDANILIERWVGETINPFSISEQLKKVILDELDELNEANKKPIVELSEEVPANRQQCCSMF